MEYETSDMEGEYVLHAKHTQAPEEERKNLDGKERKTGEGKKRD